MEISNFPVYWHFQWEKYICKCSRVSQRPTPEILCWTWGKVKSWDECCAFVLKSLEYKTQNTNEMSFSVFSLFGFVVCFHVLWAERKRELRIYPVPVPVLQNPKVKQGKNWGRRRDKKKKRLGNIANYLEGKSFSTCFLCSSFKSLLLLLFWCLFSCVVLFLPLLLLGNPITWMYIMDEYVGNSK